MEVVSTEKCGSPSPPHVTGVQEVTDVSTSSTTSSLDTNTHSSQSVSVFLEHYEPESISRQVHSSRSQGGLSNAKAFTCLCLWYIFSAGTLFSNKYILSTLNSNPTLLGCSQICVTTVCGYIQLQLCTNTKRRSGGGIRFFLNMLQLGAMRFATVVLGLVALKYVTVSFTETVKSSAPVFTVLIAWLLLGETTHYCVILSLLPIMCGLALTSAFDLSFNNIGFMAAMSNNLTDCLQNVYSKLLISGPEHKVHPAELQFYTSVASVFLQLPLTLFLLDLPQTRSDLSGSLAVYLVANGLFFHLQSFTAYTLMSFISPVTHSVANTFKRSLLIAISILIFGNPITLLSAIGMVMVTGGVMLYNKAKHYTENIESSNQILPDTASESSLSS